MSNQVRLSANIIFVSDVEKAKPWYENILGMEVVTFRPPEFLEMKLGSNIFYIETRSDKRAEGFKDVQIGGRLSAILEVDNIQDFIESARTKGAKVVVEPVKQFWGGWNAVISDPDGNEFVIDDDPEYREKRVRTES